MRSFAALFGLTALACQPASTADAPDPGELGPVVPGIPPQEPAWSLEPLPEGAHAPVSAVLPDGERITAWLDAHDSLVVDHPHGRYVHPDVPADWIAIAAARDGTVHIAWDPGSGILYSRYRDGEVEEPQVITPSGVDPNLAIGPRGEVALGWADLSTTPPAIRVTRIEDGVAGPRVHVNPHCCIDHLDEPAYTASGPSVAFDADGRLQVVYEWMSNFQTVVAHHSEDADGGWSAGLTIADAAFAPCPSLLVGEQESLVSYLTWDGYGVHVATVSDDTIIDDRLVREEYASLSILARDGAGTVHLASVESSADVDWAEVLRFGLLDAAPVDVAVADGVDLTPHTGGVGIGADGTVWLGLTLRDETGTRGALAIGR